MLNKLRTYLWLRKLTRLHSDLVAALENDDVYGVARVLGDPQPTLDGFHFVRVLNKRVSRQKRVQSALWLHENGISMPDGTSAWEHIEAV